MPGSDGNSSGSRPVQYMAANAYSSGRGLQAGFAGRGGGWSQGASGGDMDAQQRLMRPGTAGVGVMPTVLKFRANLCTARAETLRADAQCAMSAQARASGSLLRGRARCRGAGRNGIFKNGHSRSRGRASRHSQTLIAIITTVRLNACWALSGLDKAESCLLQDCECALEAESCPGMLDAISGEI